MKLAIPTNVDQIAPQLGQATCFTIVTLTAEKEVITQETVPARGEGHISVVDFLATHGIDVLLCGEIGLMTRSALQMMDLTLIPGCQGAVAQAIETFCRGEAQGDASILDVEIIMDENDPMQCMHDCAKCNGCGDSALIEKINAQMNTP